MGLLIGCGGRPLIPAIALSLLILPSVAAIVDEGKLPTRRSYRNSSRSSGRVRLCKRPWRAHRNAGLAGLDSTESLLAYLDDLVTAFPTQPDNPPKGLKFSYIINRAPENRLNSDESFNAWLKKYVKARGQFLDTPAVAGEIKEVRKIEGRVYLNVIRKADGSLEIIDGDTYQYNQERGLIVIDSPEVGLVAVLPIGMGAVSSVSLTPEVGATLRRATSLASSCSAAPTS